MSNKWVEILVKYSSDSEIDTSNLSLSSSQLEELVRKANDIFCTEIIQKGNRRNSTIIKRTFSRKDGAPRTNCSGCPALDGCSDFLNADAKDSQKELPDFSFHEINNYRYYPSSNK